jgi:hypothetical protein
MRTTVKLAMPALAIAAAGITVAPLAARAAPPPAETSVTFTVVPALVTSDGAGGITTITRDAGTVTFSVL